jgi:selenocysteine-specific elongation factor
VIAADDGIMPQTREHLDIIKLLGIHRGIFIITKIDLVEEEWVDLVEEELRNLLNGSVFENAPICRTSTETSAGIKELHTLLLQELEKLESRNEDGIFRLPIDRIFSKAGFGTIITGSVISGSVSVGDTVEILPEKMKARVRGLQTHDSEVQKLQTGYRGALNLAGIQKDQLYRGQMLVEPDLYVPVTQLNAFVNVLPDSDLVIKNLMRVRVHLHTVEVIGRIIVIDQNDIRPGEGGYIQIRLEKSIYASVKDRFIIRQFSPQITIGGGVVLDTHPPKYRKRHAELLIHQLELLRSESVSDRILGTFSVLSIEPHSLNSLRISCGLSLKDLQSELKKLESAQKITPYSRAKEIFYCSIDQLLVIMESIRKELEKFHARYPGRLGMQLAEIASNLKKKYPEELIRLAIDAGIEREKFQRRDDWISLPEFDSQLSGKDQAVLDKIEDIYQQSQYNPPTTSELASELNIKESQLKEYINILRERSILIVVSDQFLYHQKWYENLITLIREFFAANSQMKVSDVKEMTGTTRKHAIPILTFLDDQGITRREGDVRLPGPRLADE